MEKLGENIRKLILAGIGTVAMTTEKSKEILDELVKKGELTVEQGKVLNQELKHNIKQTVKNNVNVSMKADTPEELYEIVEKMTPEQLSVLKAQIRKAEKETETEDSVNEIDDDMEMVGEEQ